MKQSQSASTRYLPASRWWARDPAAPLSRRRVDSPFDLAVDNLQQPAKSSAELFLALFTGLWFVLTLPFRLTFWSVAWLGRITAVASGFSMMVVGIALWAGPLFFIGIPMFLVGLVLTLRCLD